MAQSTFSTSKHCIHLFTVESKDQKVGYLTDSKDNFKHEQYYFSHTKKMF